MATQTPPSHPTAQVVGNAFVEQYYHILHQSPDLVFKFYTNASVLSRPGADGIMTSVKTMDAINQVILSLDYKDYKAEIKTIDSQDSYQKGVIVLVTGWLTMKDNVKRKFAQSFFLAPQDKGYFVLNDVFRYVDEDSAPEYNAVPVDVITENVPSAPVTPEPEQPSHIPDKPVTDNTTRAVEVAYGNGEVVHEPSANGEVSVAEAQVVNPPVQSKSVEVPPATVQSKSVEVPPATVQSKSVEVPPATEPVSTVQEDAPKKSYASIVKVKVTSPPIYAPINKKPTVNNGKVAAAASTKRVESGNVDKIALSQTRGASGPTSNGVNSSNIPEEVEGYSIYIRGLSLNASVAQVEEEFKKFGEIKPNGVQVRSNKQNFCFGFVEFVSAESKKSAIEAAHINIGNRTAYIEEKKTQTKVGPTGRPRYPPGGRTGFRNDNFRGRGNFVGGGRGGYGRNEYGNRGDFQGRRGPSGGRGGGDGYQQIEHNVGNGRGGRQVGVNQNAVTA